jgi:ubiquinone/menaquinone biosynthesis C-methylase UbiE
MLDRAHDRVYSRRIGVLTRHLAALLPRDASVLDVGSGDGLLAARVMAARPDVRISGVDVLMRPEAHIPVRQFDGVRLPFENAAFDVVMMVDVLHHAREQEALLREMARVAKRGVLIKDHVLAGPLAWHTLAFMDWVGNARHGVALPYAYWSDARWADGFARAGLRVAVRRDALGLYPWPASLLFDRRLHFMAYLEHTG